MYHVYIPSKGRAQNCKTAQVLLADNVACTILVDGKIVSQENTNV